MNMNPITFALLMSGPGENPSSISDLSKALFGVTKRSSIVILPSYGPVSIATDPKVVDDLVDPLRKKGFASLISDVAVIYQSGIPASHLGVLKGLAYASDPDKGPFKEVTIPKTAVQDNTITFETKPGEAIKLSTLMNLDLSKRIMISPYYNFENGTDFPLAMIAKGMAPLEFVKALTRGLSGKLQIDAKTYTIGFDASSFRTNLTKVIALAQKGVDAGRLPSGMNVQYQGGSYSDYQEFQSAAQPAQSNTKPGLTAALTLLSSSIAQMNDQVVEQTFSYKGSSAKLNLAQFTSLQEIAINYLRSATPAPSPQKGAEVNPAQQPGRPNSNLAMLINRVDPRNPGHVTITTDFRVTLDLNLMQGRRPRNNQPQNIDAANTISIQVL
jgi:hypothetical protein